MGCIPLYSLKQFFLYDKIAIIREKKEGSIGKSHGSTDEYNGRYVAMKSFDDHTIVGVGDDPESALKNAKSKGYKAVLCVYP